MSFILRTLSGDGVEMNFHLGKSYTYICREVNKRDFKRLHNAVIGIAEGDDEEAEPELRAYITCNHGADVHSIRSNQKNYIMTESGKTFARLN